MPDFLWPLFGGGLGHSFEGFDLGLCHFMIADLFSENDETGGQNCDSCQDQLYPISPDHLFHEMDVLQ